MKNPNLKNLGFFVYIGRFKDSVNLNLIFD